MDHHAAGAPGAIHIVLQSKGGVGKSFVALHLAQYFADQDLPTAVFDSDPATPTLSNYRALQPRYFNFMEDDDLDVRQFDVLSTAILNASKTIVVLDTGSSNYIPMVSYFKSNRILQTFSEMRRHVVLHSVLVGGASARETLACLVSTVNDLAADGYVAWLNSLFGAVVIDGKPIEEMKAFERIRDRLTGIVRIKERSGGSNVLHLNAVREMTRRNLTYKETLATPEISLWDKQRLWDARREVNQQLGAIFGAAVASAVGN
jgi:hypothetical protein